MFAAEHHSEVIYSTTEHWLMRILLDVAIFPSDKDASQLMQRRQIVSTINVTEIYAVLGEHRNMIRKYLLGISS